MKLSLGKAILVTALAVGVSACNSMSQTQRHAAVGAALGGVAGYALGGDTSSTLGGAALGGVAGAVLNK